MTETIVKTEVALKAEKIGFYYEPGSPVLANFNLSIKKNKIVGITGPSGSGKTTLFNLLAGFEQPKSGEVYQNGRLVNSPKTGVPVQDRNLGMVFQDFALFPHLKVKDNILYGIKLKPNSKDILDKMLVLVDLNEKADNYPHELSGGQKQRVALARALAPAPSILLMDECFSNIEEDLTESLIKSTRSILKTNETTALIISHNKSELNLLCDELVTMGRNSQG